MKSNLVVVVDADVIIAQVYKNDPSHIESVTTFNKLSQLNAKLIYPTTAIAEAVTTIQRKLNQRNLALATSASFTYSHLNIVSIDNHIYMKAVSKYFLKINSKKNTIFDCIIAAVAEEKQADAIFSFDKFYKKQGFTLAEELK